MSCDAELAGARPVKYMVYLEGDIMVAIGSLVRYYYGLGNYIGSD